MADSVEEYDRLAEDMVLAFDDRNEAALEMLGRMASNERASPVHAGEAPTSGHLCAGW